MIRKTTPEERAQTLLSGSDTAVPQWRVVDYAGDSGYLAVSKGRLLFWPSYPKSKGGDITAVVVEAEELRVVLAELYRQLREEEHDDDDC